MMRVKTLKNLFPEPQPPSNKNFIKENVKSLRKMEKLFHPNRNIKGPKFSAPQQTKIIKNTFASKNSHNDKESLHERKAEETIQNGMAKLLLNSKSFHENHNSRKKSLSVVSSKKNTIKKPRNCIHGNVMKKNLESKDSIEYKIEDQKLKALSDGDISQEKFKEEFSDDTKIKWKSQGVQTVNSDDVESIYSDGVIRYPSGKHKESQTLKSMDRGDTQESDNNKSHVKHHSEHPLIDSVDHTKMNKEKVSLASKLALKLNSSTPPTNRRIGVVPKYIKERKEALQKEKQAKAVAKYTDCPIGHIPLPDSERKETLNMLKKNYQDFVRELNMLPIRTDTLRSQKRKMEIEKQLAKLEEAIKVFSRPKVFVKVDE